MENKENKIIKYMLYLGLNDKETKVQKIDTLEAYKIICNIAKSLSIEGFTIYNAQGFYIHNDGNISIENTLKIELMFVDETIINKLIEKLLIIFNQETIIKQTETVSSQLISIPQAKPTEVVTLKDLKG